MRTIPFISLICLLTLAAPAQADTLETVVARLNALEAHNQRLADENAALKKRVERLEGGGNHVVARAADVPSVIVTGSAVVPTSGHLSDAAPPQAERPRGFSWSGAYAGVHAGGGRGDVAMLETDIGVPFDLRDDVGTSGPVGGVQVGVNRQFGNLVVGAELGLSGANITGTNDTACFVDPFVPLQSRCESRVNWLVTALARVGYAHNRWLAYATAGWSIAGADHTMTFDDPVTPLSNRQSDVLDGFTYGAGANYALTDHVILGMEYLHADLKGRGAVLGSPVLLGKAERDVDLDLGRARLDFKF